MGNRFKSYLGNIIESVVKLSLVFITCIILLVDFLSEVLTKKDST